VTIAQTAPTKKLEGTDYRMSRERLATGGKILFGLALALQFGCNVLANRPIVYEDAKETAPLEVPADLVAPAANPALQIPAVAGVAGGADAAPPALGGGVAVARGDLPRASNSVLTLSDEPESSWKRAGIALERGGCCTILSKDAARRTYGVQFNAGGPKPGFFKRMFGAGAPDPSMTVQVAAAGEGTTITVLDNAGEVRTDDSAMTVLGVIEARLR